MWRCWSSSAASSTDDEIYPRAALERRPIVKLNAARNPVRIIEGFKDTAANVVWWAGSCCRGDRAATPTAGRGCVAQCALP